MKMLMRTTLALLAVFTVVGLTSASAQTPSPPGAKVYFINPKDALRSIARSWCSSAFRGWASHLLV